MTFLNKDIISIIASNLHKDLAINLLPETRSKVILGALAKVLNRVEFKINYIKRSDKDNESIYYGISLGLDNSFNEEEYEVNLPSDSKIDDKFLIKRFGKGIFLLIKSEILYVNINNDKSLVLFPHAEGLLNYSINNENSTITVYYFEFQYDRYSFKVFNSEGQMIHYVPSFKKIGAFIYYNEVLFYTQGRMLMGFHLSKNSYFNIYNNHKYKNNELFIKDGILFSVIIDGILIYDTNSTDNIRLIKLDISPKRFFPFLNDSLLILHGDNFFYEFNILSQNFKRLYFEVDKILNAGNSIEIYSDSVGENFAFLYEDIYYVINKMNKQCYYRGYNAYRYCYIDIFSDSFFSFSIRQYNNKVLKIEGSPLRPYSKIILTNELLQGQTISIECAYLMPKSTNILFYTEENEIYYYTSYNNNIRFIKKAQEYVKLVPISHFVGFYYKLHGCLYIYNLRNNSEKIISYNSIENIKRFGHYNLITHDGCFISVYDNRFENLICLEEFAGNLNIRCYYDDRFLIIHSAGLHYVYKLEGGVLIKLYKDDASVDKAEGCAAGLRIWFKDKIVLINSDNNISFECRPSTEDDSESENNRLRVLQQPRMRPLKPLYILNK
jgi:hypothetical protein